jgi:hypothetical protein
MTTADVVGRRPSGQRIFRRHDRAPDLAFAAVLLLAAVIVMLEMRGTSFFADEWDYLLNRPGLSAHTLLTPHGPHLSLLPILVYKVLLNVFGGNSYVPFRALAALDLVLLTTTIGLIARRYWGPGWCLAPMLLLVCLGPGATSILSPFQVGYTLSLLGGVWCLVALGTDRPGNDVLACLALLVSLASSSQGVGFIIGGAVMLAARREPRRAWTVILPAILYAVWYATYGHKYGQTELSLWPGALQFTIGGLSSTIAGLLALTSVSGGLLSPTYGAPLLFIAVIVLSVASHRGWRPPPMFWGLLITVLVLWTLTALSNTPGVPRYYNDPRYLSSNGLLLLALVVVCVPRPRLPLGGVGLIVLALVIIAATNANQYAAEHHSLDADEAVTRAETGSLLIMRGTVAPSFTPGFANDPGVSFPILAGRFFTAYSAHGVVSDSVAQIERAAEATRAIVDGVLERGELHGFEAASSVSGDRVAASAPALASGSGDAGENGGCRVLGSTAATFLVPPGLYRVRAGQGTLSGVVGRFDPNPTVSIGQLAAGSTASLLVPVDHAPRVPWKLELSGAAARLCRVTGVGPS